MSIIEPNSKPNPTQPKEPNSEEHAKSQILSPVRPPPAINSKIIDSFNTTPKIPNPINTKPSSNSRKQDTSLSVAARKKKKKKPKWRTAQKKKSKYKSYQNIRDDISVSSKLSQMSRVSRLTGRTFKQVDPYRNFFVVEVKSSHKELSVKKQCKRSSRISSRTDN
jgi:uncharacterized protein YcnI